MLNVEGKFSLHLQRNNIESKHIGQRLFGQMSSHSKLRRGRNKSRFGVMMVNATHQTIYLQLSSQVAHQ